MYTHPTNQGKNKKQVRAGIKIKTTVSCVYRAKGCGGKKDFEDHLKIKKGWLYSTKLCCIFRKAVHQFYNALGG